MIRSTKQKVAVGAPKKSKLRARCRNQAALSSLGMPSRAYMPSPTVKRLMRYGSFSPAAEWRSEQQDCLAAIARHQDANQTYFDEGVQLRIPE